MNIPLKARAIHYFATAERLRAAVAVAGALASSGIAHADTIFSADATVKGQAANNPYLVAGPNTSAESISASISPMLTYNDGTGTFRLLGNVQHTEFSRFYSASDNYSISSNLTKRLSPKLSLFADLGYDSSITTANDLLSVIGGTQPVIGPTPTIPGAVAINALQRRRVAYNGDAGFDYQPTAFDTWHIRSGFSLTRYPAIIATAQYNYFSSSIGYDRVLNGRSSIGFNVALGRVDYLNTSIGDARTVSPQVTFSTQLDANWSLSGSAGATVSSTQGPVGKIRNTGFSGSANLCRTFPRAKLCVFGSRSVQPSLLGGVVPQTNVGASYSVQLDARSDIAASGSYTFSERLVVGGAFRPLGYGRGEITYSRRITERLKGFVGVGYAGSYNDVVHRDTNYELNCGLTYSIGGRR